MPSSSTVLRAAAPLLSSSSSAAAAGADAGGVVGGSASAVNASSAASAGGFATSGPAWVGFLSAAADVVMVIGTSPGWVAQLRQIIERGTAENFSWQTTLLLLVCYTMRVGYFFGERYHIALLLQCAVMIVVVLCLLAAIADAPAAAAGAAPIWTFDDADDETDDNSSNDGHVATTATSSPGTSPIEMDERHHHHHRRNTSSLSNHSSGAGAVRPPSTSGSSHKKNALMIVAENNSPIAVFHQIKKFISRRWAGGRVVLGIIPIDGRSTRFIYTAYAVFFAVVVYLSWHSLPTNPTLTKLVGFAALGIEASTVLPQVWMMERERSTEGLSRVLLVWWCCGDLGKVLYFVAKSQPTPFVMCGLFQLSLDAWIIGQIARFKKHPSSAHEAPSTSAVAADASKRSNI